VAKQGNVRCTIYDLRFITGQTAGRILTISEFEFRISDLQGHEVAGSTGIVSSISGAAGAEHGEVQAGGKRREVNGTRVRARGRRRVVQKRNTPRLATCHV
jgi:hypothetical protein